MSINYTPLNLGQANGKNNESKLTVVLIIIATVTAAVLAALLFFLIQKKLQQKEVIQEIPKLESVQPTTPVITNPPSPMPSPIISTSEANFNTESNPQATGEARNITLKTSTKEANLTATATPTVIKRN